MLVAVVLALVAPLSGRSAVAMAAGAPVGSPAGASSPAAQRTEAAAMATAIAAGRRVEVTDLRSETRQVFANPDGTVVAEIALQPARVHRPDGSWAPVDTTLRARSDGTVAPVATPVDLAFSGGGSGPLARISRGGKSLAMSWPKPLPAPTLDGGTARYADVLPGVDLQVTASSEGFSEQLVIKNSAAAANPALAAVRLGLDTPGLTVRTTPAGGLAAIDAAGGTVFQAPAPSMWDSAAPTPGAAPAGSGGPGAHRAAMGAQVTAGVLEIRPDLSILTAPDTRFPVVIDPTFTYQNPAWTEVNAFDADSSTWRTVPTSLAVGFQDFQPPTRVRSFLRFGLDSRVFGAHILSATLTLFENWSASCQARSVDVYLTGGFDGTTTWNHQPGWGAAPLSTMNVAHGHDAGCASAGVDFDVTAGVVTAAHNRTAITLGLRAGNENDALAWKKFTVNPTLMVVYNHKPSTPAPTSLSTKNPTTACATTAASAPHVNVTANGGIHLYAKASDPDADMIRVAFDFRPNNGSPIAAPIVGNKASGSSFDVVILQQHPLTTNVTYAWRVIVQDVINGHVVDQSPPSAWCFLVQDGTAPSPPEVTSTDYPSDAYAGFTGDTGDFTLSPGATIDTDLVSYSYGLDQPTPLSTVPVGAGGTAVVSVAPSSYGPHDLWVRAKDSAGNLSSAIPYHFYVGSPNDALANWKFDEGSGTTTTAVVERDPEATGPTGTLSATGVSWFPAGKTGAALHFDGVSGWVDSGMTIRIDRDFSVSAWVRLASKAADATVISEQPSVPGGFSLRYVANTDQWCFSIRPGNGSAGPLAIPPRPTNRACSSTSPQVNVWTHLVGWLATSTASTSHGAHIPDMGLYVNGAGDGGALYEATANSGGTLEIGRAFGQAQGFWSGDIDDVRVYDRPLRPAEAADLVGYVSTGAIAGSWAFNEASGSTAADSSGKGHPATLSGGAAFAPSGHSGGQLALNGATAVATTAVPVLRTDKSLVVAAWVRLSAEDGEYTVVSADGVDTAGFTLQYDPDDGGLWTFGMPAGDLKGADPPAPAKVAAIDRIGAWVHLTGVYDGFTHVLQLRVVDSFGTRVAYGSQDRPWNASGGLQIGRSKMLGDADDAVYGDYLAGAVDDLKVYSGVLVEADLRTLDHS
jgi:hypothetical protein